MKKIMLILFLLIWTIGCGGVNVPPEPTVCILDSIRKSDGIYIYLAKSYYAGGSFKDYIYFESTALWDIVPGDTLKLIKAK